MNVSIRKGVNRNRGGDRKGTDLSQEGMEDGGLVGGGQRPRAFLLLGGILGLVQAGKLARGGAALHLCIGSVALG